MKYTKEFWLWFDQSLELYLRSYKVGNNYENSTVLIDFNWNIIAFFDNKTEEIDIYRTDAEYNWNQIIANWKVIDFPLTPFKQRTINITRKERYKEGTNKVDNEEKEVREYNINYFDNLLKNEV